MGNPLIHRQSCSAVQIAFAENSTLQYEYTNASIRMGLTPLAGLPGATRSGDIDPS